MANDENLIDLLYDLSSLGMDHAIEGKFDHLDVEDIWPERKDRERAKNFDRLPKGVYAGGPLQSKADPQAKAITNSAKLVRRSKAVAATWGTGEHETVKGISNPWTPFKEKLVREGFRTTQIEIIAKFRW